MNLLFIIILINDDDDDNDDNNNNLGRKIGDNTGDDRSTSFLFQQISVLTQRFNVALLNDSFMLEYHLY